MKTHLGDQIDERVSELDTELDALGVGNLTLASFTSSSRGSMLTQHIPQSVIPENPDVPYLSFGGENVFGHFSNSYRKAESKYVVMHKIVKNELNYVLVVYIPKEDKYDVIERKHVKSMAKQFGYKRNNTALDNVKVNDTIPKGTMCFASPCLDEYENFMYGKNALVGYVVSQETLEDGVCIGSEYAEAHSTLIVDETKIPLNENDIPLNLFGDKTTHKAFPNVGEYTDGAVLFGSRRKNNNTSQYMFTNKRLRDMMPKDDIYKVFGQHQVVDINVWCNKDIEQIPDIPAYRQIKKLVKSSNKYYKEINKILGDIIEQYEYTPELARLWAKSRDTLDKHCKWNNNDRVFSNVILEFVFAKSEPIRVGSKITGRYGNKSIVSRVLPQEEMGYTEDGRPLDIRIAAPGVLGRLNSGQVIEVDISWISTTVRDRMAKMENEEDRIDYLCKYLEMLNSDLFEEFLEYMAELDKEAITEMVDEIIDDNIYNRVTSLGGIDGMKMRELYKEFKPEKQKLVIIKNGEEFKTIRPMIFGHEYIMRLEHEPIGKFSVRSKGMVNPRTFLPIKSMSYKRHKAIYQDQAGKIGEQESPILSVNNDPNALDYLYRTYANSVDRRQDTSLFNSDPLERFTLSDISEHSRTIDILNAYLASIGLKIEIEYNDKLDLEPFEEPSTDEDELPDFIKDLFAN